MQKYWNYLNNAMIDTKYKGIRCISSPNLCQKCIKYRVNCGVLTTKTICYLLEVILTTILNNQKVWAPTVFYTTIKYRCVNYFKFCMDIIIRPKTSKKLLLKITAGNNTTRQQRLYIPLPRFTISTPFTWFFHICGIYVHKINRYCLFDMRYKTL